MDMATMKALEVAFDIEMNKLILTILGDEAITKETSDEEIKLRMTVAHRIVSKHLGAIETLLERFSTEEELIQERVQYAIMGIDHVRMHQQDADHEYLYYKVIQG